MPRCMDCKLYDLDKVKNARGAILSNRIGRCLWKSTEQWPVSVVRSYTPNRPSGGWMEPKEDHRCPCFQKVGTP